MSGTRDRWTDRLSEYLDDGLEPLERAALEAHLEGCADCASTLDGLRAVARRAAALAAHEPGEDLWPAIEARIAASGRTRGVAAGPTRGWRAARWSFSLPQLAAAAVLIALLSSAGVWLALSRRPAPLALRPAPAGGTSAGEAALPASFEVRRYDAAIAELQGALRQHRNELDPKTVEVIEKNLRIIDQATEQARRALAADPANPYLNDHLAAQLRLKVDVLRQATALVATHG
jgi:anti-sigma factor RsiW